MVLVDYVRQLWYDDHFDIARDSLRLGKTLVLIAGDEDNVLSRSYKLVGLALWEKYDGVLSLMKEIANNTDANVLYKEAVGYHLVLFSSRPFCSSPAVNLFFGHAGSASEAAILVVVPSRKPCNKVQD